MSFWSNLKKGARGNLNPFGIARDVGDVLTQRAVPVLGYALAPTLGPVSGIASAILTNVLNYGFQFSLQKWEKWNDRREVNRHEVEVKKSIHKFVKNSGPKAEEQKRNKLAAWLNEEGAGALATEVKNGNKKLPDIAPTMPTDKKSLRHINKVQSGLEEWVNVL